MPRAFIRSVSPSMLVCHSHKSGSPNVLLRDSSQQTEVHEGGRGPWPAASQRCGAPMRRASSLDTLCLLGQWPRDRPALFSGVRPADKATQTPEEWASLKPPAGSLARNSGLISPGAAGDCLEKKLIRQRLQRNTKEVSTRLWSLGALRQSPVPGDHSLLQVSPVPAALPIAIPGPAAGRAPATPPRMRSSVEGLNQEIERLVQQRVLAFSQFPVDGHLAPVDELLMLSRRSVNTQTPVDEPLLSPALSAEVDLLALAGEASKCSTPELELSRLGSSPQINRFLAGAPPDGCERVCLKSMESTRRPVPLDPLIKPAVFELKPSLGSAFSRPPFRQRGDDSSGTVPTPAKPPPLKAALSKS
ncbi:protein FAM117B-like [Pollicipes pollicipes]|uniref:protein FAM117B-like n=1 Tax=Pollicipes pollicipes TaxID=41117 RepID=UPI001885653A|nr:protein FAM117B-like [Pollicipes pollicipes]XP_037088855.1 protein FAM117B-like [Pollicipes pollicipes]